MTDYSVVTGTSGKLIIRDTGTTVQAIISNSSAPTFINSGSWSITVGSGSASGHFSINGVGSVVVWSGNITVTTAISFTMAATGTQGLGGPATVSATIYRATVPSAVQNLNITNVKATTLQVNFSAPASNGGASIDYYLIRIGTNNPPTTGSYTDKTGNSGTVLTGLSPGVQYYVTVYAHNSAGYSTLATPVAVRTLGPFWVKVDGVWKLAQPYVKVNGAWKLAAPFVKVGGVWKQTG